MADDASNVSQSAVLLAYKALPDAQVSQAAALAAYQRPAFITHTSQALALAAYKALASAHVSLAVVMAAYGTPIPQISQIAALTAYRTGPRDNFTTRAWAFELDGHQFYVLHLALMGTWVYDLTSGTWYHWETSGLAGLWNMEDGLEWNGEIVAGDNQEPVIWMLDPSSALDDDYKPITRKVTGIVPLRGRETVPIAAVRLTMNLGSPSDGYGTVKVRWSDDNGKTWGEYRTVTLVASDFDQDVSFRSLGLARAPGRVFEVLDIGGTIRIDDAQIEDGRGDE